MKRLLVLAALVALALPAAALAKSPSEASLKGPGLGTKGDLGPKYTIDYTVPGPDGTSFRIRQDVYPYAKPYAVTYMASGQKIFDTTTRGGWYENPMLKKRLSVPKTAPAVLSASSAGFFSTGRLGAAVGAGLMLAAAAWFYLRRRPGQSAA